MKSGRLVMEDFKECYLLFKSELHTDLLILEETESSSSSSLPLKNKRYIDIYIYIYTFHDQIYKQNIT